MDDVIPRRALGTDLPQILQLMEQVDDLHREALPWLLRKVDDPRPGESLDGFLSEPDKATFVIGNERLLGVIMVFIRNPNPLPIVRPTRVAEIDVLVVDTAQRRQGVGRQLVQTALAWAQEHGATRTELGVYEFNDTARAFWSALGFETLSRRLVSHSR